MQEKFLIKYAKLHLPVDIERLQSETKKFIEATEWSPHLNRKHYTGNWEVLPLRSPGGNLKKVTADQMNETAFMDTPLMDEFPSVKKVIGELECPVMAVRLLNLKTGAIIKPHRDFGLCFEKGEARIHVPVFTNPAMEFVLDEERLIMNEGESWYINANLVHSVSNHGATDRIHLVIDCTVNEWLKNTFAQGEKVMMEEKPDVSKIQKMIYNLRLQNTALSHKL